MHPLSPPGRTIGAELPNEAAALLVAKKIAASTGFEVVVTDETGNEVCSIGPDNKGN